MTTIRRHIEEANSVFLNAFNRGDVDAAIRIYAEDAVVLPPLHSRIRGTLAIRRYWQSALDKGTSDMRFRTETVEVDGNHAYEVGSFSMSRPNVGVVAGKYLVVWRREKEGAWRWYVDIWNLDPRAS